MHRLARVSCRSAIDLTRAWSSYHEHCVVALSTLQEASSTCLKAIEVALLERQRQTHQVARRQRTIIEHPPSRWHLSRCHVVHHHRHHRHTHNDPDRHGRCHSRSSHGVRERELSQTAGQQRNDAMLHARMFYVNFARQTTTCDERSTGSNPRSLAVPFIVESSLRGWSLLA